MKNQWKNAALHFYRALMENECLFFPLKMEQNVPFMLQSCPQVVGLHQREEKEITTIYVLCDDDSHDGRERQGKKLN